ncbi:MAG TPA: hypothetical protein VEV38_07835 [Candidatus Eremiobacteraceae bacterium]|nr:hypothetical protein [Candidatus Eremiobacteraceae bacterium]
MTKRHRITKRDRDDLRAARTGTAEARAKGAPLWKSVKRRLGGPSLDEKIAATTPETAHPEYFDGPPRGTEAW